MFETVLLTIGSFLLTILLLVVYSYRIKDSTTDNHIYRLLLIMLLLVLGSEIISVYTIYYKETFPLLNEIVCRIHCLCVLGWIFVMALYILSLGKPYNATEFKNYLLNELHLNKLIILYFLIISISLFLDFDYVIIDGAAFLDGPALYYTYFIGIILVIVASIIVYKRKTSIKFKKLPIIILIVETIITLPISLIIPQIYIVTTSFTFKVFVLYFLAENPDLYAIRELQKINESIESSSRAKTEFLSNLTSEIKAPIKTIIGLSESLANKVELDKEEDLKMVKHIYYSSDNLVENVNNILDLSKIETSSEVVLDEVYDLKKILAELMSIINSRISKNVVFKIIVDDDVPSKYKGDKNKIFKILLNLLSNSVKYTEVGKITLRCYCKKENKNCLLCFKLSDTGMGIKKEDYNRLFEKFSRLDDAIKKEIEGLGLGLILTKKLVDLMNGKIWFDSTYGVGTTFYVELEQKIIDTTPISDITESNETEKNIEYIDLLGKKVLLVDDNKLNLKVAEKLLKFYKFDVTSVTTAKEAIYNIKNGDIYDIIFLDHMMPEMDGIEAMHILKKLSKYFNIPPIVVLTANAITGMKEMYLKEGFDDYLAKPINISSLDKIIHKYFDSDGREEK